MKFIFDMDGTIVDSFKAVKQAYRKAGFKGDFSEHWGMPWKDWCTQEVHDEKVRVYPNFLREFGRVLPAANLLKMSNGIVITSASSEAAEAVKGLLKYDFKLMGVEMTHEAKNGLLSLIAGRAKVDDETVLYFDDDVNLGMELQHTHENFHFMHVTEQEGVYHLYEKNGRVQRWTLSSWLPGATRG